MILTGDSWVQEEQVQGKSLPKEEKSWGEGLEIMEGIGHSSELPPGNNGHHRWF